MTDETTAQQAEKMEEVPAPSTSAEQVDGADVDAEAKRLMAAGSRDLVMKDVRSAVNAFQEASSLLGKKYGETADQCADAFYYYGMALLELARMENNVLGNALEGMPEEEDEESDKDPNIPSASNLDEKEREELREQVYDAMAEQEEKANKENGDSKETEEAKDEEMECEKSSDAAEVKDKAEGESAEVEKAPEAESKPESTTEAAGEESKTGAAGEEKSEAAGEEESKTEGASEEKETESASEKEGKTEAVSEEKSKAVSEEKSEAEAAGEESKTEAVGEEKSETEAAEKDKTDEAEADSTQGPEDKPEGAEDSKAAAKPEETTAEEEKDKTEGDEAEPMEGEEGNGEEGSESENEEAEEKENEEEEVGNLQLAWEMLDLSKIIFKRHPDKASQLKAAQAHLKLGEVSIESENYTQAVEDFLACLTIQKEHLEEHDRLLAETHYQLGLAYQYSCRHEDAISHFTQSIDTIEKRLAVLTEQLEKATEESKEETQKEMEELKGLLPDIKEKIEDSKEAQKTAEDTDKALKETLGETSSGFPKENGGTSTSAAAAEKSGDCTVPVTNCVSDISHLVRKKRKPEEESPLKDAKKSKSEPVENGSGNGDAVVPTNEKAEAENETPMDTAAVESTA